MDSGQKRILIVSYSLQLIAWTAFTISPLLLDWPIMKNRLNGYILQQSSLLVFYLFNYFYLIPRILHKKGVMQYGICGILSFVLLLPLFNLLEYVFILDHRLGFRFSWRILVAAIQVFAVSTTFRMLTDRIREMELQKELNRQKELAELGFLRSQINPHFLFNTLNNITALVRTAPDKAEESIGRLSDIMRYMLNAGKEGKVSLSDELDYIRDYVALQRLRIPSSLDFKFICSADAGGLQIEPLCLIAFIENAFKHGSVQEENDFIHIQLRVQNNTLILDVMNSKSPVKGTGKTESGIGLENIRKRLDLSYKNRYQLDTRDEKEKYAVHFSISLQ